MRYGDIDKQNGFFMSCRTRFGIRENNILRSQWIPSQALDDSVSYSGVPDQRKSAVTNKLLNDISWFFLKKRKTSLQIRSESDPYAY
jgi:hypothetical protein